MRIQPIGAILLYCAAALSGQETSSDAPKPSSIAGTVADGKSGEPVRKAIVVARLIGSPETAGQKAPEVPMGIGTVSDQSGKFELRDLKPGVYLLSATRDGYALSRESAGKNIVVKAKEDASAELKMFKTGVVSGRVLDPEGEPVRNASVALRVIPDSKRATQSGSFSAGTNDRGEYRVFNIPPGDYQLSVTYRPNESQSLDVQMQPAKPGTGLSPESAFPTLFYPGVLNAQEATAVTLPAGSELQGYDFHLRHQRAFSVQGRVVPATAAPIFVAFVVLAAAGRQPAQPHVALARGPGGDFVFPEVLPGTYSLSATTMAIAEGGAKEEERLNGQRTVQVTSADLKGVQLSVGPPVTVSGHLVLPEGVSVPAALSVMLWPRTQGGAAGGSSSVAADGSFTFAKLPSGDYDLVLGSSGSTTLYLSAIRMGDTDVLAEGLIIAGDPVPSLEVFLKPNAGTLAATAVDENGKRLAAAQIWLVPDSPKQRQMALFGDCRTDAQGECRVTGITPGEYHAYAFPLDINPDRRDPDSLKPFEKAGKTVTFAEGETKKVELTVGPVE